MVTLVVEIRENAMNGSGVEKRRFPRLAAHIAVQYRNLLRPSEPYKGSLTFNLSAGGLAVKAPDFFSLKSRLLVQVNLPGIANPVRSIGQVVWIRKEEFGETYDLGIHLVEMEPRTRGMLADFVERGIRPSGQPATYKTYLD
tara:strand:- start:189 stop:614 length:426 start_codon:yes stop_codon:yes gene_type:complete